MARSSFAAEMLLGMKELGSPGTFWNKEEGKPCSLYRLRFIAACIGFGLLQPVLASGACILCLFACSL